MPFPRAPGEPIAYLGLQKDRTLVVAHDWLEAVGIPGLYGPHGLVCGIEPLPRPSTVPGACVYRAIVLSQTPKGRWRHRIALIAVNEAEPGEGRSLAFADIDGAEGHARALSMLPEPIGSPRLREFGNQLARRAARGRRRGRTNDLARWADVRSCGTDFARVAPFTHLPDQDAARVRALARTALHRPAPDPRRARTARDAFVALVGQCATRTDARRASGSWPERAAAFARVESAENAAALARMAPHLERADWKALAVARPDTLRALLRGSVISDPNTALSRQGIRHWMRFHLAFDAGPLRTF